MKNNKKYFNIPITMLKELHTDSEKFFHEVFKVGTYLYSKTLTGAEVKRYNDAKDYLGINQSYSASTGISVAKEVLDSIPSKYPIVGIDKMMLFDYQDNEKSEYDNICLSAFLGIKSIIGKKPYDKTNKDFINARMFGYASTKVLPAELTPLQLKYKKRYHMDKVLLSLQNDWHLKMISHNSRGMYVSYDLSLDELAIIIVKNKQDTKAQQLRDDKKNAIEKAQQHISDSITTA